VSIGEAVGHALAIARGFGTDWPWRTSNVVVSGEGGGRVFVRRVKSSQVSVEG
jgi:hypothetical protein